uniref:BPTI/Kunitz inhibitor domain-containing protein n=1 Tax=Calidris pygmaea TaxID=425635 RepID=A0A8C3KNY5_9CHAR
SERECQHCAAPQVTGPCRAAFPRWFYSNGTCQKFIYGGCRGNKNNFQTREECLSRCGGAGQPL